jgi:hypothetical protein
MDPIWTVGNSRSDGLDRLINQLLDRILDENKSEPDTTHYRLCQSHRDIKKIISAAALKLGGPAVVQYVEMFFSQYSCSLDNVES